MWSAKVARKSLGLGGQQAGYTFNEVLVSIALIGIGILGFSLNTMGVIRGNYTSGNFTIATNLAQEKMEQLKAQTVLNSVSYCPDAGEKGLTAAGTPRGIYDRCWSITDSPLGPGLKRIDVTVSWRDSGTRAITISTLVFTG